MKPNSVIYEAITVSLLLVGAFGGTGLDSTQLAALQASATVEDGIAWVKAIDTQDSGTWTYEAPFNDLDGFVDIAQYATSFKWVTNEFISWTVECSNPVWAMNHGYELSYTVDETTGLVTGVGDGHDWQNSGWNFLASSCLLDTEEGSPPNLLTDVIYWACGNTNGLRINPSTGQASVNWGWGGAIDIYLGFDATWSTDCYGDALLAGTICDESAIATFDWDELMESGTDKPEVVDFNMDVNETDLSLNILVKLTYEGASSADVYGQVYGTTYVLDFEDFNAHSDAINEPGTCQNRNADDFTGAFSTFWA
eukprot:CAMPEP_0197022490 /NCGR_PEP_ID=MMETSP1384-20130603/3357_1 /TAXON_ID=29189 /ORGANISM="Ammonia sp." /LENGTH=309 /DNA_ID=CAMNT_0042450545 /DNA_START=90 /DNA_END=1016 /DNA_ORIENTATION=+